MNDPVELGTTGHNRINKQTLGKENTSNMVQNTHQG